MSSGKETTQIGFLVDHRQAVPIIAAWFYQEWSFMYPGWTVPDFARMIARRLHKDRLPLILVAYEENEPAGTVSLKRHDKGAPRRLGPWVTSLYVVDSCRSRGIGSRLMAAAEETARKLGEDELYLLTYGLEPYYSRLGWEEVEQTFHEDYLITIMKKRLFP
jgi:GNAT superfamily N-acetyltransferase